MILSLKIEFSLVDIVIFAKGKNNLYAHIIWNNSLSVTISFSTFKLLITGLSLGQENKKFQHKDIFSVKDKHDSQLKKHLF